ncbi:Copia protein [Sesamum angolense]|uniref:Copia protein n=1 Tax=Sesamum angolense TaxID=2727404 RepID=A0AAE1W3D6_9LAMI|nr:Copia protein [Sesamum angolense]
MNHIVVMVVIIVVVVIVVMVVDIVVVILKMYLSTRSGKMVKENLERKIVGKLANMWRLHAIVVVEKFYYFVMVYSRMSISLVSANINNEDICLVDQIENTTLEESPGINNMSVPEETQRKFFGPVVRTPEDVKPMGYKWVIVRERNEQGEIGRYKARLVAQGFSQKTGIDNEETYSPVMDTTTFRYLISLAVKEELDLYLLDVVTAYLYSSLDNDIYMKLPEGFHLPEAYNSDSREYYSVKLNKSLYG